MPPYTTPETLPFDFEKTLNETVSKMSSQPVVNPVITCSEEKRLIQPHLLLPYQGKKGENILRGLKNCISTLLPKEVCPRFIYKGKKTFLFKSELIFNASVNCIYFTPSEKVV